MDKDIPLFFPQNEKSEKQQACSSTAAKQPTFHAVSNYKSQTEGCQTTAMEIVFPIHKSTPCKFYAEGANAM